MDHDRPPRAFFETLHQSLERLKRAGIIAEATRDARGAGEIRWTDAWYALLMAGRRPEREAGFQAAWDSGDAEAVRRWVEAEAAALRERPPAAEDEERP